MVLKRRELIKGVLGAGSSLALLQSCQRAAQGVLAPQGAVPSTELEPASALPDRALRELADIALSAARDAGATYADVRIADYRWQAIHTREARVLSLSDDENRGFGVRVIVNGTWGFAASPHLNQPEIVRVARQAVALARAQSKLQREPVELVPVGVHQAVWNTPLRRDAFDVTPEEKIEKLLAINALALRQSGVNFVNSSLDCVREHKFFASSEGSYIEQTLERLHPSFTITSIEQKRASFQTRNSYTAPSAMGYEYVEDYPWDDDVRQAAADAVAKHTSPTVAPGKRDLILHPSHLWLTIHESIGHPTELDRALGMEANFAGTSFLTPDKLGSFQLGSEIVNVVADKTSPGSLATCGYDDDGAKTVAWPIVERGRFVNYQVTRDQARWIGRDEGFACSYAQSWKDVPFQRMPNVNLLPGEKQLSLAELIASTDDAILIKGHGSFSIDHQRYNFQFGGQTFWEIKKGKIVGSLRDVAYQAKTPEFWAACDAICSADEYAVGGAFYDGKGEPAQSNPVSHGCAPARFRQVNVLNTARRV